MDYKMSDKQAIRKLIGLLTEYKHMICIIIVSLVISTILNFCIPLISRKIMDEGFIAEDWNLLVKLAIASFLIYAIITSLNLLTEKLRINLSAKIQYSLNEQAFNHLMRVRMEYYDKINYTETFSNLNMDISNMISVADEGMFFVVTQIFSIIGGIIGLFLLDYRMTIIVVLIIPVKYVVMKHFARKQKEVMDSFIDASKNYAGWFGDTVGGVREVRLLGILNKKQAEFSNRQIKIISEQKKLNMLSQWNIGIDSLMVQAMVLIIYIVGANLVFNMGLTIGTIFAFITYSAYVTGPISAILNIKYLLSGIIPSTKRYYEFMSVVEEDDAELIEIPDWRQISFNRVTFSYSDNEPAVEDVDLCIAKGKKVALIGKNGCGKSTLVDLLLRLRTPQKGTITLDNIDIRKLSIAAYREMFAVVSQDVYLFNDSIRNNICLYQDIDEKNLLQVCDESGLSDFIREVSFDYNVGANGSMLSGGQKQKIALARALLLDRPIIILDEATSNVDVSSELQVNELLNTSLKDKTVIVISHRKSVLYEMEQVILMDDGRVMDKGKFDDLLKTDKYLWLMEGEKRIKMY